MIREQGIRIMTEKEHSTYILLPYNNISILGPTIKACASHVPNPASYTSWQHIFPWHSPVNPGILTATGPKASIASLGLYIELTSQFDHQWWPPKLLSSTLEAFPPPQNIFILGTTTLYRLLDIKYFRLLITFKKARVPQVLLYFFDHGPPPPPKIPLVALVI